MHTNTQEHIPNTLLFVSCLAYGHNGRMGPFPVPPLCGVTLLLSFVLFVLFVYGSRGFGGGGLGLVRLGVNLGVRGVNGGLCLLLPPHRLSPIVFSFFGAGEEEAVGHLVKGGVALVFHLRNTTLVAMDTANCAHYPPPPPAG